MKKKSSLKRVSESFDDAHSTLATRMSCSATTSRRSEKLSQFVVHVSPDNRYKLYVNEELVSVGPALGDIQHWNYEIIDLAPYLKSGNNIIAAQVWNEGNLRAVSQFSYRTGFYLQGTNEQTQVVGYLIFVIS
jgi:hypothetical protein